MGLVGRRALPWRGCPQTHSSSAIIAAFGERTDQCAGSASGAAAELTFVTFVEPGARVFSHGVTSKPDPDALQAIELAP